MKTFSLMQPKTLDEAVKLLAAPRGGGAAPSRKLLAGGQDLLTEMKEHLEEPEELVNLKGIPGLGGIDVDANGQVRIGALCTIAKLAEHPIVLERMAVLAHAAQSVASPQIRSQGTVGGNLCQRPRCWYYRNEHARCLKKGGSECFSYGGLNKYNAIFGGGPSYIVHPSDLAPAFVALSAVVDIVGPRGARSVDAEKFYTLPAEGEITRETVLAPDEIVTAVRVPPPASGLRSIYVKFKERESFDFALVSVAACIWKEGSAVRDARLVLGGVAPIPWRVPAAEKVLAGAKLDGATIEAASQAALVGAEPLAHNGYKVPLARAVVARALSTLTW